MRKLNLGIDFKDKEVRFQVILIAIAISFTIGFGVIVNISRGMLN